MRNNKLREIFMDLQAELPDLVEEMQPLGMGKDGFVLFDDNDDTIRKIHFKPKNDADGTAAHDQFEREVLMLQAFAENPLVDIEVPILVDDPQTLDHESYMATYLMTRVKGTSLNKLPEEGEPKEIYEARYKSAGTLLAKFHRALCDFDIGDAAALDLGDTIEIVQVEGMETEINEALERANSYLQANMMGGNIHGNLTMPNVMGHGGQATGLIDFSHTGYAKNIMVDFWGIPEKYLDTFIEGYETESGKEVKHLVSATLLALYRPRDSVAATKCHLCSTY